MAASQFSRIRNSKGKRVSIVFSMLAVKVCLLFGFFIIEKSKYDVIEAKSHLPEFFCVIFCASFLSIFLRIETENDVTESGL